VAAIDVLTFMVTRTSHPVGHICEVQYTYFLSIEPDRFLTGDGFSVVVQLHAEDSLFDQYLGKRFYDAHVIDCQQAMPVKRRFVVPCEVLDEALGVDRIYLKLIVKSSDGEVLSQRSATVEDRF